MCLTTMTRLGLANRYEMALCRDARTYARGDLLLAAWQRRISTGRHIAMQHSVPMSVAGRSRCLELTGFGRGVPVDKEASVLTNEAEVVAGARARARGMIDRHPGREPDSFRLTDASGKIFGVFPIDQR
jgi:hypothetical protein